jgi:hypothetical protein
VRSAGGAELPIELTGSGVSPGVATLDTATVRFDDTRIHVTSSSRMVVVTNTGESDIDVSGPAVEGDDPGDFAAQGCQNVRLAPGESCDVVVAMTPTAVGPRSALLQIAVATGTGPSATLIGAGTAQSDVGVSLGRYGLAFTAFNNGPDRAADVVVNITVTGGTIDKEKMDGACKVDNPGSTTDPATAVCRLGAIDPNAGQTIQLPWIRTDTDNVRITATVGSSSRDPVNTNDSDTDTETYVG